MDGGREREKYVFFTQIFIYIRVFGWVSEIWFYFIYFLGQKKIVKIQFFKIFFSSRFWQLAIYRQSNLDFSCCSFCFYVIFFFLFFSNSIRKNIVDAFFFFLSYHLWCMIYWWKQKEIAASLIGIIFCLFDWHFDFLIRIFPSISSKINMINIWSIFDDEQDHNSIQQQRKQSEFDPWSYLSTHFFRLPSPLSLPLSILQISNANIYPEKKLTNYIDNNWRKKNNITTL